MGNAGIKVECKEDDVEHPEVPEDKDEHSLETGVGGHIRDKVHKSAAEQSEDQAHDRAGKGHGKLGPGLGRPLVHLGNHRRTSKA